MREIKFRCWDKYLKKLYPISGYFWEEQCISSFDLNSDPNYIMQEFIGLKDKNGKEIYEGDIVKGILDFREYSINGDIYRFTDVVIYKAPEFMCENAEFPLNSYTLEVIGNVFENKDLLCQDQ